MRTQNHKVHALPADVLDLIINAPAGDDPGRIIFPSSLTPSCEMTTQEVAEEERLSNKAEAHLPGIAEKGLNGPNDDFWLTVDGWEIARHHRAIQTRAHRRPNPVLDEPLYDGLPRYLNKK